MKWKTTHVFLYYVFDFSLAAEIVLCIHFGSSSRDLQVEASQFSKSEGRWHLSEI